MTIAPNKQRYGSFLYVEHEFLPVNALKSQSEMYWKALDNTKGKPEESLMVAAHAYDLPVAKVL